jgi:hypothetical protein
MRKELFQRSARTSLSQHRDYRVVSRHRTRDTWQRSLVDPPRHHVGSAGRRPYYCNRFDELDRNYELADESSRAPVAADRAHKAQLLDIARDRCLCCAQTSARKGFGKLLLRVNAPPVHQGEDCLVALSFGRGHSRTFCITA